MVEVQEKGKAKKYSAGELAIRRQLHAAMNGDRAAIRNVSREIAVREKALKHHKWECTFEVIRLKVI